MTQITFNTEFKFLQIAPDFFPEADEFSFWGQIFLNHNTISILETSEGADRHQIRFCWQGQNFNLNFEHYSDSLWISSEGIEAELLLEPLQLFLLSTFS
ncbi:DUF3630 family protein [Pseudoalteromonas phenolica]|uniref:DUF3630 domain-containing protein n=1 Tax=Pseudoalteromonas phenolica TaxID=161398 RepID=A0A0S2K5N8_9GAMM|nr:DUF3630 family protein [Pseudoalteromonas phenolica]ALO43374.1 hypothetical protein PP2015_2890 [Pseudoalteromonas phenolica]MBE0355467.1 hypothetical protein [Pseudoalteromonas phenolica O-BC30]RXF02959.1 DUF3630 family protein [Pseudoalteromonas phenolica O-BC30]TMO55537.1 DUF3630 domain-containing protein [Pseudoalteromonas phenolica]